jgi:hypothetical protein
LPQGIVPPDEQTGMVNRPPAKDKQNMALAAVLAGIVAYFGLFYATRLPTVEDCLSRAGGAAVEEKVPLGAERPPPGAQPLPGEAGRPAIRRIQFLGLVLLLPDEWLLGAWFGSPPEFALWDRVPVLLLAGAILSVAAAIGWLLMVAVRADRGLDRLETLVFSTAVGLNAVSTLVLAAGLAGMLRNRWVFVVPGVCALAAAGWLTWRRRMAALLRSPANSPHPSSLSPHPCHPSWLARRGLWLAVPFAVVILLGAMLPPVDFDVLEYHLQAPKEWFQQGRIGLLPHNVYGNMPLGTEMLSLLAMVLADDWWLGALAGKTVTAAFTLLTGAALFTAGRRFHSTTAGVVAALVYLSTPWIVQVSTNGLVDGVMACYALLAVYAVLIWRNADGDVSRLLLAGYLAGAAAATKYPGLLFVVLPLIAWIALATLRPNGRSAWGPVTAFLLAATLGCGLWLAKNAVLTGNPVYPLLYSAFDGKTWTPEKDERWNRVHRPHDFSAGTLVADLARLGWRSEWLSPLLIPLAVLALARRERRQFVLAILALLDFWIAAWWLLTHRIDRFWVPALPMVALLAGLGACWRQDRVWRMVLVVLLAIGLGTGFLFSTAGPGGYNRYFVSLDRMRRHPEEIDSRVDPWHQFFNKRVQEGRLLLVGDARPFDLEMPVLYDTCFDDCLFERLARNRTPEEVRAALADQGISYVFVHWGEIERYRRPGNYGFTDFVRPEVFDRLVAARVLVPLPTIEGHPGRGYRVVLSSR